MYDRELGKTRVTGYSSRGEIDSCSRLGKDTLGVFWRLTGLPISYVEDVRIRIKVTNGF